tara:strand:- start:739 stop:3582 length:2844 start_codon:yes stop_codon:yes gene_type:complete
MSYKLHRHQQCALETSIQNDFKSGTHAHATGSGKSIIGHSIVREYSSRHPGRLMIWLCEQLDVISQIFSKKGSRSGVIICDLVKNKHKDWWWTVQSALYWGKPVLVIINRAFLVSGKRYEKIDKSIGLVIHDECHTASGDTTRQFYSWLKEKDNDVSIIGLSATPPLNGEGACDELSNILTNYSIYDAAMDGVIVPLRMSWCDNAKTSMSLIDMAEITYALANENNIKKIIVWCGTIDFCMEAATEWSEIFDNWLIAVDTSKTSEGFDNFEDFYNCSKGILFCAAKHKEGSDIPGLGMGVFVDGVEERGSTVFVQCAGRVLRRPTDGSYKPYGIILDLKARDGLELCDRVGSYLQLEPGAMPWTPSVQEIAGTQINSLTLTKIPENTCIRCLETDEVDINTLFIRSVPDNDIYKERLKREMILIKEKGLILQLLRAIEVLRLAGDDVPHVTRGSCGSSLVCYLLGISHIDPVKFNICFSRFLNEFRSSMPDIDYDFPHNQRADIFLRMAIRWPGTVARISNHVHYHEKSAIREALRRNGLKGNVPCTELTKYIAKLSAYKRNKVKNDAKKLEGSFNCYSLHCGGVVYYPHGIPRDHLLEGKQGQLLAQVKLDKRDISDTGHFKIDVLSSRALSQLVYAFSLIDGDGQLDLANPPFTDKMKELFENGDNIGVTLAESPLCKSEFMKQKPKTVEDIAKCLALIRPAARQSKVDIVYDDDAIEIIQSALKCTEAEADGFRRGLAKRDDKAMTEVKKRLGARKCKKLADDLGSLSLYGFCKAHAMSYAQLVAWLAWCKTVNPTAFWGGALNSCQSSYKPWVHLWEAKKAGLDPFHSDFARNSCSVYSDARRRRFLDLDMWLQIRIYWYWDMNKGFFEGCYDKEKIVNGKKCTAFKGVIANHRKLSDDSIAITIGTGDRYIDTIANYKGFNSKSRIAQGVMDTNSLSKIKYI